MKLVCDRGETLAILERFRKAGAALFAPNGELPAEIEGLCMGAQAFADAHRLQEVPLAIGMTGIYADRVVVEGAPDKIYDPKDVARLKLSREDQLSKPDFVAEYAERTGVDLVVPNLGTEHRSMGVDYDRPRLLRETAHGGRRRTPRLLHGSGRPGGGVCHVRSAHTRDHLQRVRAQGSSRRLAAGRYPSQHVAFTSTTTILSSLLPGLFDSLR